MPYTTLSPAHSGLVPLFLIQDLSALGRTPISQTPHTPHHTAPCVRRKVSLPSFCHCDGNPQARQRNTGYCRIALQLHPSRSGDTGDLALPHVALPIVDFFCGAAIWDENRKAEWTDGQKTRPNLPARHSAYAAPMCRAVRGNTRGHGMTAPLPLHPC